jgi:hypothetical protein
VVRARRETRLGEEIRDAQRGSLKRHIDDARPGRTAAHAFEQQRVALRGRDRRRQQRQIRPVEARHDRVGLVDAEPRADVVDDGGRGRRRQRQHALGAELAGALGELQVVRPEVVAPLGDAVRLVDREERDLRGRELPEEALVVEALRRDVEQLELACS